MQAIVIKHALQFEVWKSEVASFEQHYLKHGQSGITEMFPEINTKRPN